MCLYTEINIERERVSHCPYVGHVWKTALSWVCQVENGSFLSLILTGPTAGRWAHTYSHTIIHHHTHSVLTMWWKILHLFSPLFPCIAFGCVCVHVVVHVSITSCPHTHLICEILSVFKYSLAVSWPATISLTPHTAHAVAVPPV